jgi:uncharacterized protein (DUF924 family)
MTDRVQDWAEEVRAFWFGLKPEQWWEVDPELDEEVRGRFRGLLEEQSGRPVSDFLGSAEAVLAAVILFDQLPRNMFRGVADQFATDHMALAIAKKAVERGYDETLAPQERGVLYMPFQHSEDLDDQQRSVALFTALGDDYQLGFAKKHLEVIERFGRFPHRNAILGRTPRPAEVAAGDVVPW